jgi:hypothetical protein
VLRGFVATHGPKQWAKVAAAKQCAERWHNHLDLSIKKVSVCHVMSLQHFEVLDHALLTPMLD